MEIVNTKLLSHPANWLLVWLIAAFAGFAFAVLHTGLNAFPIANVVRPTSDN